MAYIGKHSTYEDRVPAQVADPDFGEIYACLTQGCGLQPEIKEELMQYTDLFPEVSMESLEKSLRHVDLEIKRVSQYSDGYVSPSPYNPIKKEYDSSLGDYYCKRNLYLDKLADFTSSPLSMESISLRAQRDRLVRNLETGWGGIFKRFHLPLGKRKLDDINHRLEEVEKECRAENEKLARLKSQCDAAKKTWDENRARMNKWEKENSRNRILIRLYETKTDLKNILEYKTRHRKSFGTLSEEEMYRFAIMFQTAARLGHSLRNMISITEDAYGRYSTCVQEILPRRNPSDLSTKRAGMTNDFDDVFNSMFGMHDYRKALNTFEKSTAGFQTVQENLKQNKPDMMGRQQSFTISR